MFPLPSPSPPSPPPHSWQLKKGRPAVLERGGGGGITRNAGGEEEEEEKKKDRVRTPPPFKVRTVLLCLLPLQFLLLLFLLGNTPSYYVRFFF